MNGRLPKRHGLLATRVGRGAALVIAGLLVLGPPTAVVAQNIGGLAGLPAPQGGAQMLLESDQLVFDYDVDVIAAVGNVKVYYAGYKVEADRLTYDQRSGRLVATGRVQVTEPSGNVISAEFLELDDNFRDGFVRSIRVATVDRTYFAAETATRTDDRYTEFNRGVYTACEPCAENPERPPIWQVRAARIVHDQQERTVYFKDAALEMWGVPVLYIPYAAGPDPTVRRRSGFLMPVLKARDALGFGVGVPYFWAIAPNMDLTFSPMVYSRQGFLADVEWRHRLENAEYSIHAAGIRQLHPEAFLDGNKGTFSQGLWRGAVRTIGKVYINQYWTAGWDGTLTSDRTFTRDYGVLEQGTFNVSTAFLTGLRDRNFFEVRGYYFQDTRDSPKPAVAQGHQPIIRPVVDYRRIWNDPILGGEIRFDANLTSLLRELDDPFTLQGDPTTYYRGVAGDYSRLSGELSWQDTVIGPLGQVFKPFAYARADGFFLNNESAATQLTADGTAVRGIAGAGLEWRWPWLLTAANSAHIIEPIIQVVARPNGFGYAGILPNEDAQSLIFDDTNLLAWDKFSGYDRMETGTRVNFELRYFGTFSRGTIEAVVGQSYQVAGINPFAEPDIANTGARSGLETAISDYVGRITATSNAGSSLTVRGRFDEKTLRLERGEVEAQAVLGEATATTTVAYQRDLPDQNGKLQDVFLVTARAEAPIGENWTISAAGNYNVSTALLTQRSIGLKYDDECFLFSLTYSESHSKDGLSGRSVSLRLSLRTLGDVATTQAIR